MIVCKRVQVLRPRTSTSGGQSGGGAVGVLVEEEVCFLVRAAQEAKEVQERQLEGVNA